MQPRHFPFSKICKKKGERKQKISRKEAFKIHIIENETNESRLEDAVVKQSGEEYLQVYKPPIYKL
jgi:hypothetical protein